MQPQACSRRGAPGLSRILRASLAFVCSAATVAGPALPATAADSRATVTVTSGSLGLSSAPAVVALAVPDPGVDAAVTIRDITVADNRAGTIGWSATVTLTDFTGTTTGDRLSAAGAAYTPTAATTTGTAAVTASSATDLSMPRVIQAAAGVSGNNAASWNAELRVNVPEDAMVDTYTATLTYSVS
ncbi:hypothetical protein [Arthrobacter oryzae]|uniref:hypothetical protein n=1 Tax=Arthrobacter oryzae TaxID=409290 RepID=UPI00273A92AC|nr:hypothetical protein [Arthrobacter oryzae]WLQ07093.1 hypothetical protein Q8Z05_02765 [Arthrobacter oryzae]